MNKIARRFQVLLAVLLSAVLTSGLAAQAGDAAAAATQSASPPGTTQAPAKPERPARVPAAAYAKRSGFLSMYLSPDGKHIASRVVVNGKVNLAVLDRATMAPLNRIEMPEDNTLQWYKWAGNDKLLISMTYLRPFDGEEIRVSRLMMYRPGDTEMTLVGKRDMGFLGDDLLYVDPAGAFVLLAIQESVYDYPSVWRFPLDGKPGRGGSEVQASRKGIWEWVADNAGTVRWGVERARGDPTKYWYRSGPDAPLKVVARLSGEGKDDEYIDIRLIVAGSDEGYALRKADNGRIALRKFNFATRTDGEVVAAVDGHDVDDVWFDYDSKPAALIYANDYDRVLWLDPAMNKIQARLDKAMTESNVWISSLTRDYSRMLVWIDHEDDPGQMFIFDAAQRTLDSIFVERPALYRGGMAKPAAVTYSARDQTPIRAYLTLPPGRPAKNLPLIILPHGGPYGVRDQLEFSTEVQLLANRGYAVIQPNYRGSQGFGEAFEELGRGQIGRKMQDDLDDAMDWAVKEGIADRGRVCVVGASYGGYAALWAVIRNPERYRCGASFAGVTDWNRQLKYDRDFFSAKGARKWRDRVRGEDESFNLDQVSPVQQIARLTRPVLLTHGNKDTTVPFKQFRLMRDAAASAGKPLETIVFEGEGHGFDKEENEQKWYEALEAFLQKHNPPD